ncbi:PfkB family carbohydrate kinase [Bradyrhizobium sp.]|uniref:PfkB family carbohydrate kinase n=1 Tax=Bradyrhizobium sp. TaxID=376 RepID=UPI003C413162
MESSVAKLIRKPPVGRPASPREKVRTLDEVGAICEQSRSAGRTVVQAHGTFDLLHLGHVRHLEAARKLGDVLIVTVTADRFVNKGPGRPVFNAELRAEMLATLEYVDWVAVNDAPDAVSAIERIRPSIYIKGQDYQNPEGDITGKITLERDAVEAHGGRIHFTDEVMFSSTELINRHLNIFEPHIREHLDALRQNGGLGELCDLIESVADYRVLLVGDAIIDEYQYVLPMHKTPKENMIATRYQDRELFAGGVFAAANHVASFCKQVDVLTCLGDFDSHEDLVRQSLKPNVGLRTFTRPGAPTTLKRRFVDPSYMRKLFEVYFMNDEALPPDVQAEVDNAIAEIASDYDVVIATDFGHGLIASSSIDALTKNARFLAVNTQSNSANLGYNLITKYKRADYVCIDAPEARLAVSDRVSNVGDIARRLAENYVDCSKIIVTQGKHGCVTFESGGIVHTIPAFAKNVIDTVGAGDAFLAVTAPLVAVGAPMDRVGFIGNVVGALKVEIVGHRRSIEKVSLIKGINGLLK